MGDSMPKEQFNYITKIQEDCLTRTNMSKEEALDFAFKCWQLGYKTSFSAFTVPVEQVSITPPEPAKMTFVDFCESMNLNRNLLNYQKKMTQEYENIMNMTDQEAANIIGNLMVTMFNGRGNGKVATQLRINTAFSKAISALMTTEVISPRQVVRLYAKNKTEAISALEMLLEKVKNTDYNNVVKETVEVLNEGDSN